MYEITDIDPLINDINIADITDITDIVHTICI